jgi:hypothetical protein
LWLEKYTPVSDQVSSVIQCKTQSTDDEPAEVFTLNGTTYSLIINGSAVQAPGSEIHIESLDHVHRFIPYVYVSNATRWEGSLNLQHAVPLGSVDLIPGGSKVKSIYQIVEVLIYDSSLSIYIPLLRLIIVTLIYILLC